MPNWCDNFLTINADEKTVNEILEFVKSEEYAFDFNNIVPMPDYIYTGMLGDEERKLYGENNWYDWCCENWGTKWNAEDVNIDGESISMLTAWAPCIPVIAELAKRFPEAELTHTWYETGMLFCGCRVYQNGETCFAYEGDFNVNWFTEDDDEDAKSYELHDELYPIKNYGIRVEVADVKFPEPHITTGKIHYREYENRKIYRMTDGWFVATDAYNFQFADIKKTA